MRVSPSQTSWGPANLPSRGRPFLAETDLPRGFAGQCIPCVVTGAAVRLGAAAAMWVIHFGIV